VVEFAAQTYKRLVQGSRVWTFGLEPVEVSGFLADYGWKEREHVSSEDYRRHFILLERNLPIMRIERVVLAEKLQRTQMDVRIGPRSKPAHVLAMLHHSPLIL
jgi:hypothetical protein